MKVAAQGLSRALGAGLKPFYLILGEEPYAALEAADAVRAAARSQGFDERVVLFVEPGFSWNDLHAEAASGGSLFGGKRLIEVKVMNGRIDAAGQEAVAGFAGDPPPDALLLITVLGCDYRSFKAAWAKNLAALGVLVECRQLGARELDQWIRARLAARGLRVPDAGIELIAERAQGNLHAAAQTIERLGLLGADGQTGLEEVREAAVDEARYGLFDLADAALAGQVRTALRMLVRLRETGSAPEQVLWVVARDLRLLAGLAWAQEHGGKPPQVWPRARAGRVNAALRRRRTRGWQALLAEAARIDRINKGRIGGEDPWQRLERLVCALAGARAEARA